MLARLVPRHAVRGETVLPGGYPHSADVFDSLEQSRGYFQGRGADTDCDFNNTSLMIQNISFRLWRNDIPTFSCRHTEILCTCSTGIKSVIHLLQYLTLTAMLDAFGRACWWCCRCTTPARSDVKLSNSIFVGAFMKGNLTTAVAYYREAIRLCPEFADAHSNLGNVLKVMVTAQSTSGVLVNPLVARDCILILALFLPCVKY